MTDKAVAVVPIQQLLSEVEAQGFTVRVDFAQPSIIILHPHSEFGTCWTSEVRELMSRDLEAYFYLTHLQEGVEGGQGRTSEELRADARVFFVLGLLAICLGLVIGVIWLVLPAAEVGAK